MKQTFFVAEEWQFLYELAASPWPCSITPAQTSLLRSVALKVAEATELQRLSDPRDFLDLTAFAAEL